MYWSNETERETETKRKEGDLFTADHIKAAMLV